MNRFNYRAQNTERSFYGFRGFQTVSNREYYQAGGGLLRLCAAIFDHYIFALAQGAFFAGVICVAILIFSLDPDWFLTSLQEIPQLADTANFGVLLGTAGIVAIGLPLTLLAIHCSYFAWFESRYGKTPGKFLIGLSVHDANESLPK